MNSDQSIYGWYNSNDVIGEVHEYSIGVNLLYLVGSGAAFVAILILIESNVLSKAYSSIFKKRSSSPIQDSTLDDDVRAEKRKVDALNSNDLQVNSLVLKNLSKFYGQFLAVNQLSLAVKRFERSLFSIEINQ